MTNASPIRLSLDLDETSGGFVDAFRANMAAYAGLTEKEAFERFPHPENYSLVKSGWFADTEQFLAEFNAAEARGLYREMVPFDGVVETVRQLVDSKVIEVHVVTAREEQWRADTTHWLEQTGIPFRSLTHTHAKHEIDTIDVYIDDSDSQLTTLQAHGKQVIAFDHAWNRHVESPLRVTKWAEVPAALAQVR